MWIISVSVFPWQENFWEERPLLCGKLRSNRKYLPHDVVAARLQHRAVVHCQRDQVVVLNWKISGMSWWWWRQRSRAKLSPPWDKIAYVKTFWKPYCILSYKGIMCGVSRSDQLTACYPLLRKYLKWQWKVVLRLLYLVVKNTYLVYQTLRGEKSHVWYRQQIILCLLQCEETVMPEMFHSNSSHLWYASQRTSLVCAYDIIWTKYWKEKLCG